MPDRVLRDELWLSDRFLDLPTDACRLTFIRMLSEADDFGNMEGGTKRMFRMLAACTQIKTEAATASSLSALIDADLIRCYVVDGRELIHIPRFRSKRWYLARKVPPSPWCDVNAALGKTERQEKQALSADVDTTLSQRVINVAQGVGVGVGVGVGEKKKTARATRPPAPKVSKPEDVSEQVWEDWLALRKAKRAPVTMTVLDGARREAAKAGMQMNAFLSVWCRRGSQGLEADWLKPNERNHSAPTETAWQRSQREKIASFAPSIAAKPPRDSRETIDIEARHVTPSALD